MKVVVATLFFASVLMMAGCTAPSERELYATARRAVLEDSRLPPGAEPAPREDARVFVAKNAASVYLPCRLEGETGAAFMVWLKRVGIRWELDRVEFEQTALSAAEPSS